MAQIGHYGTPALIAGGLAVALLVLHLALPFGVYVPSQDDRDFGEKTEWKSRGDVAEEFSDVDGYGPAAPGATLAGIIIAMVAGILLVAIGLVPVPVVVARFAGWTLGFLGASGALIAAASSAYWGGQTLTVAVDAIIDIFAPNGGDYTVVWAFSPFFILAGAIVLMLAFLRVMTNVVAKRDGLRDQMARHVRAMKFAAILLLLVVSMPWATQFASGQDRRDANLCALTETCPSSLQLFSALGHGQSDGAGFPYGGIMGIAEATQDAAEPLFQHLAFSIKVLTAVGWIGFLLGGLVTAGHLMSSAFKLPAAAKFAPGGLVINLVMALWGGIQFILANSYQWSPNGSDDAFFGGAVSAQLWAPSLALIVVGVFLALWSLGQYRIVREVFAGVSTGPKGEKAAVTFD